MTQNATHVSAWADQSGNGNHAAQPTVAMQPTYSATGVSNRPCIHFDGLGQEGQMLAAADSTTLQFGTGDFLVEVVARYDNATNATPALTRASGVLYVKAAFTTGDEGVWLFGNTPPISNDFIPVTSKVWAATSNWSTSIITSVNAGYNDGAGRVLGFRRAGSILEIRAGGFPVGTTNQGMTIDVSAPGAPLKIGATGGLQGYPEGSISRLDGDVCEVIAVKGSVSGGDLASIEGYLKAKYGL